LPDEDRLGREVAEECEREKEIGHTNDQRIQMRKFRTQACRRLAGHAQLSGNPQSSRNATGVHTRRAFEEMFVASRPKFLRMAYGMLRNTEDEEAVQNAFVSACLHLRKFEGRSALRTWFTRIVFNTALMMQRKRKVSRIQPIAKTGVAQYVDWTEAIPASEPNPEEVHGEREAFECIEEIPQEMNPSLRQAFAMSYFEELSNQEACAMFGVSLGTFKARLFRARQELSNEARLVLGGPIRAATPSSFFGNRGAFQAVRSKSPQFVAV
jgi:RNA polymerase sigma factor (sigma-70 family)